MNKKLQCEEKVNEKELRKKEIIINYDFLNK